MCQANTTPLSYSLSLRDRPLPHGEKPGLAPHTLLRPGVHFTSLMAWTAGTGLCVPRTQVAQLKFHPQNENLEWDI